MRFLLGPAVGLLLLLAAFAGPVRAGVITLENGLVLEGKVGKIGSMGSNPFAEITGGGEVDVKTIMLLDDDLRRTFVSSYNVRAAASEPPTPQEKIKVWQRVASSGRRIATVGPILHVTPFDQWGRRIFSMNSTEGRVDVVQGITEITPTYTKVEGLLGEGGFVWDMRIATSSIPRDTLSKIIMRQIDPENLNDRLRIVRLYIQSERYQDARAELQKLIEEFPEAAELREQVQTLTQMSAQRVIDEIKLRRDAGQHQLALRMIANFPTEGVAGATLLEVRDLRAEYDELQQQGDRAVKLMEQHLQAVEDDEKRRRIESVKKEIAAELNIHTIDRMADYLRLADDSDMTPESKLALAISGWMLGSGEGTDNLAVALSVAQVRDRVIDYLRSERQPERDAILAELEAMEGSAPSYLAKIVAHIKPPLDKPEPLEQATGLYELSTPGAAGEPSVSYHIQLPPEYHPHRRYPCIVTLDGAGTDPLQQIDWWAGAHDEKMQMRLGQGARRGYIVIAPTWTRPHQSEYEYSAREHAAVLLSLRDAIKRFSIDTDRVFLTGHSMGGTAAWDIGLAHPDLWAGVMPFVAEADKYIEHYWENGRDLPMYFVSGQMDGNKLEENGPQFDRYFTKVGFDAVVVEYLGRGHEHFHDEVQRIFDWMGRQQREFFPQEFEAVTMRPWDNFFWWAEVSNLPSRLMTLPAMWPPQSRSRPVAVEGRIGGNNNVYLTTGANDAVVWLSPEMVDFDRRIRVTINRRNHRDDVQPSARVLLEDVRTRGDRQHPFWAKVEHRANRR